MPDGGARSATLGLMITLSLTGVVRRQLSCADHFGFMPVVDTYRLAVASPLSLLTFFAAAKKVSAAPHRGEANRPITKQGKANTPVKPKNQGAAGKKTKALSRTPSIMLSQKFNKPINSTLSELICKLRLINLNQPGPHHIDVVNLPTGIGLLHPIPNRIIPAIAQHVRLHNSILTASANIRRRELERHILIP